MTDLAVKLSKPWPDFLRDVDAALSGTVHLHCIGGFILAALYGLPRPTADIDYIETVPREAAAEIEAVAGIDSALARKYKLFLQRVGIVDFPEDYKSRLQELKLNLQKLKLWAFDPYDLLLSKLPRNTPKDRGDAKYLINKLNLDFATFSRRWQDEMAPWIANKERHATTLELWRHYFPGASQQQQQQQQDQ